MMHHPQSAPPPGEDPGFAPIKRFLHYLWPQGRGDLKRRVAVAVVMVLLSKAVILSMPFAYKHLIDRMTPGMEPGVSIAVALVLAYVGARFGGVLFDNLRNVAFLRVGQEASRALALDVFRHLHDLSMRFHLERRTGALTKIAERGTRSIDTMLYFLLFNIAPTIVELIAVCVIFVVNFGWGLVVATVAMIAAYIWFTRTTTEWRAKVRRDMVEHDNHSMARATDSLLNYETVKYFTAEDREAQVYGDAVRAYTASAVKNQVSLAILNVGQALITNAMMFGAMGYTVWGWSRGRFTTGDVVLINTLLAQLFRPLDLLGMVYNNVRQGLIDMEQMFRLVDTPAEIVDVPGAPALQVGAGEVRFDHVAFAYNPERTILQDLSFAIPGGHTLAVVGHSGAGKSTLSRLLFRFYDVTGGRILIDGQDIAQVSQESLRRAIGIVPQDTVLFNDTIAYNIAYGAVGASQEQVEQAARGAAIHDFILSLPDGYATQVGERGLKLSGGEKQRVAIARTLLKNPPVLILDEATSALDSRTEAGIQATLDRIAERRTTIIIAHRLSTVVHAEQIIVMDGGRIVERGTHADLLGQGGVYASMWMHQLAERSRAMEAA